MTNIEKQGYQPVLMRIYNKDKQLVMEDEVLYAYDTLSGKIMELGREARKLMDDNQIAVVNPLKWGVVGDFDGFQKAVKFFVKKVTGRKLFKQRLVLCVPARLTQVEKKAFEDVFMMADMKEMTLVEKSFEEADWKKISEVSEGRKPYDIYVELVSEYYSCEYFS